MPKGRRARLFNFLAAVCLGLSVISCGWVIGIAVRPDGRINPFPPKSLERPTPVAAVTATATSLPEFTQTPVTPEPIQTLAEMSTVTSPLVPSSEPTQEASPTSTPTIDLSPTPSPSVTSRPSPTRAPFTYTAIITLQVHPVQLCDWMGIAGTVTDLQGRAAPGTFVRVWGLGNVDQIVAAGSNPVYGPAGWEVRLARAQIVGSWNVQLIASPETKAPLSDVYRITMPGDCKRNLARVSFQQNH